MVWDEVTPTPPPVPLSPSPDAVPVPETIEDQKRRIREEHDAKVRDINIQLEDLIRKTRARQVRGGSDQANKRKREAKPVVTRRSVHYRRLRHARQKVCVQVWESTRSLQSQWLWKAGPSIRDSVTDPPSIVIDLATPSPTINAASSDDR